MVNKMDIEIKNTIKKSLKEKNISEEELARILKVEYSTIIAYEVGVKFPPINTLKKMCLILEKSPDELYTGISKPPLILDGLTENQKKIIREIYLEIKK